jgi:Rrf2 family protein
MTRNSDYALRALLFIAHRGNVRVSADELIGTLKVPDAFLRRLLQELSRKGILFSHRGKGGGFSLRKEPSRISVGDVMRVFQKSLAMNDCRLKKHICPNRGDCPLRSKLLFIESNVLKELEATTIASLMKG